MTFQQSLKIRPMTESDLDAVLEIDRRSDTAPHWARDEYQVAIDRESGSHFQRIAMVAELGGEAVGFAVVRVVGSASAAEAELESIVIDPVWRNRGLGECFLMELARQAKEDGASRLDLEVRASNSAAIRLYLRAGFRETGRRRGYYRNPDEDAVLMSATL